MQSAFKKISQTVRRCSALLLLPAVLLTACAGGGSTTGEALTSGAAGSSSEMSTDASQGDMSKDKETEVTTSQPVEPVSLLLVHDFDESHADILKGLVNAFNRTNDKGVTVYLEQSEGTLTDMQGEEEELSGDTEEGKSDASQAADLLIGDVSLVTVPGNKAQSLNAFLEQYPENFEAYREELFDASSETGVIKGLPFSLQGSLVYYNKTMLSEVGATVPTDYLSLLDAGEKVLENKNMALLGVCTAGEKGTTLFEEALLSYGASLRQAGSGADSLEIGFDSKEGEAAITDLLTLYRLGYLRVYGDETRMRQDFSKGAIAGFLGTDADVLLARGTRFETEPALLALGAQKYSAATMKDLFVLTTDEQKIEAVYTLMAFLSSENTAVLWAIGTGDVPVTKSALDFKEYRSYAETEAVSRVFAEEDFRFFFADKSEAGIYVRDELKKSLMEHSDDEAEANVLIDELKALFSDNNGL